MMAAESDRWAAIRRGRGALPPIVNGLEFFGDLSSPNTSIISGAVAQLGDSSGWERHSPIVTSTERPTYSASDSDIGGRPSMLFDRVDDAITTPALPSWDEITLACVIKTGTVPPASTEGVFSSGTSTAGAVALLLLAGTGVIRMRYENPSSAFTSRDGTAMASNTVYRVIGRFRAIDAVTVRPTIYYDGTSVSTGTAGSASNGQTRNAGMRIGKLGLGSNYFGGKIVDPLIYSRNISAAEAGQIDDWLKWRNGL